MEPVDPNWGDCLQFQDIKLNCKEDVLLRERLSGAHRMMRREVPTGGMVMDDGILQQRKSLVGNGNLVLGAFVRPRPEQLLAVDTDDAHRLNAESVQFVVRRREEIAKHWT